MEDFPPRSLPEVTGIALSDYGEEATEHLDEHILIRGVGLNARGKLDRVTREIASQLDIPHHREA